MQRNSEMIAAIRNYGTFDFGRLWIGALYYATGIPYLLKNVPPFADFLRAHVAGIEAPPFTPMLTNPITIVLAALGLYRLCWKPDLPASALAILRLTLIGHASAVFLILAYAYFTLRYRRPRSIYDLSRAGRIPLVFDYWRPHPGDLAQVIAYYRGGVLYYRHPGQPLHTSCTQGVGHRRADEGAPRSLAVRAVCP